MIVETTLALAALSRAASTSSAQGAVSPDPGAARNTASMILPFQDAGGGEADGLPYPPS